MIFPNTSKEVGFIDSTADYKDSLCSEDIIYFSTKYLIIKTEKGYRIHKIEIVKPEVSETEEQKKSRKTLIRNVSSSEVIADEDETIFYDEPVMVYNRTALLLKAAELCKKYPSKRAVIFKGYDYSRIFIADPDADTLLNIHVYDNVPPYPNLVKTIENLEAAGVFGNLGVRFIPHIKDIRDFGADAYPCCAGGFDENVKTLDRNKLFGGENIAGCQTSRQFLREMYPGKSFEIEDTCPADRAVREKRSPYIARCCRIKRCGLKNSESENSPLGIVVHWASDPKDIEDAVFELVRICRGKN